MVIPIGLMSNFSLIMLVSELRIPSTASSFKALLLCQQARWLLEAGRAMKPPDIIWHAASPSILVHKLGLLR